MVIKSGMSTPSTIEGLRVTAGPGDVSASRSVVTATEKTSANTSDNKYIQFDLAVSISEDEASSQS